MTNKRIPWTMDEIETLLASAGKKPIEEIAQDLGRPVPATREQWRRHRCQGETTRVFDRKRICLSCGERRHLMTKKNLCTLCAKQACLDECEAKCADVFTRLTQEQKATYAKTELSRYSRPVLRPARPDLEGLNKKARIKAELKYEKSIEWAKIATIHRKTNACKKRLQRMREKTGENPRKLKNDV